MVHELAVIPEVLRVRLAGQAEVVAETRSGRAAVALSELLVPDVVVIGEVLTDGVAELYVPDLLRTGARVLFKFETT